MMQFAVIGLGRFGSRVAVGLYQEGAEVVAVDSNEELVDEIKNLVTTAVVMDATDEHALATLKPDELTSVIVAIGKDVEASILVTALLREMNAPKIMARASNELQARILRLVGADAVIYPEDDMASRLVRSLVSPLILDQIELYENTVLAQVVVPDSFVGSTLRELDLRAKHGLNVVTIKAAHPIAAESPQPPMADNVPNPDYRLQAGDTLVVVGDMARVRRIGEME